MDSKDQAAFYLGAIRYDLDSEEVDLILAAGGLSVKVHSAKKCVEAIRKNIYNWTPGGPVYDWSDINRRAKEREVKADRN